VLSSLIAEIADWAMRSNPSFIVTFSVGAFTRKQPKTLQYVSIFKPPVVQVMKSM
jgi:hypothetical protein